MSCCLADSGMLLKALTTSALNASGFSSAAFLIESSSLWAASCCSESSSASFFSTALLMAAFCSSERGGIVKSMGSAMAAMVKTAKVRMSFML
ncbi:hypothetical protein PMAYCL1PPCAC_16638, partial [Pristionchus mayeri]